MIFGQNNFNEIHLYYMRTNLIKMTNPKITSYWSLQTSRRFLQILNGRLLRRQWRYYLVLSVLLSISLSLAVSLATLLIGLFRFYDRIFIFAWAFCVGYKINSLLACLSAFLACLLAFLKFPPTSSGSWISILPREYCGATISPPITETGIQGPEPIRPRTIKLEKPV